MTPRVKISTLRVLTTTILLTAWLSTTRAAHGVKRTHEQDVDDHHDNVWFQMANLTAKSLNVSDCYVCSFIPHHSRTNPCLTPRPIPLHEIMCVLAIYTALTTTPATSLTEFTHYLPNCTTVSEFDLKHWRTPQHYTSVTNETNSQGITTARYPYAPSLCFRRNCAEGDMDLGVADCESYLPVEGVSGHPLCSESKCKDSWVKPINFTEVGLQGNVKGWVSEPVMNTKVPHAGGFPCPAGHVWVCGHRVYLYLPQGWCGACYLAKLQPAGLVIPKSHVTSVFSGTTNRRKRSTEKSPPLISDGRGILMTLFPMYGTAHLAHKMNDMHWELEQLTQTVLKIANQLRDDPEKKAMRAMILQNRIGLDYLLASQGGLCAIIGDHCCTFIPDGTSNYTHIVNQLQNLKDKLVNDRDKGLNWEWNPFSWFISGSWSSILLKICTPILIVLLLLLIFLCCIVPIFRTLTAKAITGTMSEVMLSHEFKTLMVESPFHLKEEEFNC